jgi:putative tricarboxylic transport membrane protein
MASPTPPPEVDIGGPGEDPEKPSRPSVGLIVYGLVAALVIVMGVVSSVQRAGVSPDLRTKATLIAPAAAGGGWDLFMRQAQNAMRENDIASNIQVLNVPGAAGTIGLSNLERRHGEAGVAMVGGAGQVAGVEQLDSPVTLSDVTPIARVVEEYDVIVVPADSPFETLDDLITTWQDDPGSVPFTGGGSFDQLVMAELAIAAGIEPSEATYIPASGGGEVAQSLVTRTAAAAASGYADVKDQIEGGRLRALGLAAEERLDGVDIPTLEEQGYDVTFANWRAVFAPPGISDEEAEAIRAVFEEIVDTPEWREAVEVNEWTSVWLDGDELLEFLADEEARVAELYEELGL